MRNTTINKDYFKVIDSSNKAYFLGFLHADGCITRRQRTKNYEEISLVCTIVLKDREILDAFCKEINLSPDRVRVNFNVRPNEQPTVRINITTKELTSTLLDLKADTLFKRIPEEFKWDFIRGVFDGDGSIYERRNSKRTFYFAAAFASYGTLTDYLRIHLSDWTFSPDKRTENLFTVTTNKQDRLLTFYDNLYKDKNCIKLNRKHLKFLDFLAYTSSTRAKARRRKSSEMENLSALKGGENDIVTSSVRAEAG